MTRDEFNDWFLYHAACFTGIHTWLRKVPGKPREGQPGRADVLAAWARALSRTDLDDAKAATDKLFEGAEEPPRSYEKHPAAVAAIARKIRGKRGDDSSGPRYIDGHETFHCTRCQDDGRVFCWHTLSMKAAADKLRGASKKLSPIYSCVVACDCQRGEYYQAQGMARFNAKQWLPLETTIGDPAEQQRLLDFMAAYLGKTEVGHGRPDPDLF